MLSTRWRGRAVPGAKAGSRNLLARQRGLSLSHVVHDHADNRGHDCARYAATDKLPNICADVDAVCAAREHWNERGEQRPAGHAADCASDRISAGSEAQVVGRRANCVAADSARDQLDDEVNDRCPQDPSPTQSRGADLATAPAGTIALTMPQNLARGWQPLSATARSSFAMSVRRSGASRNRGDPIRLFVE